MNSCATSAARLYTSADEGGWARWGQSPCSVPWSVVKLFVTGGAGFIGSNYVRHVLTTTDDSVTVFDALTYAGNLANLRDLEDDVRYRFVKGDVTDRHAVEEAMAGHDAVLHFAAESHVDRS